MVPQGPYNTDGGEKLVVFEQRKVMLSRDLPITPQLRKTITDKIIRGGGQVVDDVDDCDWFVCQFRDGPQYIRASQQGKEVGNLAWLYHLIVYNEYTSPMRRLLHYPIPRDGLPGFKGMRITISNYGGDARIYLENLIKAAGAEYTKSMKSDNTHLITARLHSEKCEAAKDWNIEIVNHLWIEESYAACEPLPLTNSKYQHFPPRTNLGEVVGQTFLNPVVLRQRYFPGGEETMNEEAKMKHKVNERAQKNALKVGLDRDFNVMQESSPAGQSTKKTRRSAPTTGAFSTPAKGRHVSDGKENETPSTMFSSASRSAKAQALSKLHDLSADIALYEKEKKRTKDGIFGGKRAADQIEKERVVENTASPASDKRPREDVDDMQDKRPAKRAKTSLPEADMRICLTGYKRWAGDKSSEEADRVSGEAPWIWLPAILIWCQKKLRALGIQIVQDTVPFTHLAAPSMIRTQKFLVALAKGPDVISSDFVTACIEKGKRPNVDDYRLRDKAGEEKFGITIETAVARARANRGRLLFKMPIYCTEKIPNGPQAFEAIAKANGAIFMLYRGRPTIKPTTPEEDGGAPPEPVYLLSGPSEAEKQLWPRFEEMAIKGHMEPRIVVADWLLDVCMRQELFWDPRYLWKNREKK